MDDLEQVFDTKISELIDSTNRLKSMLGDTPVSSQMRDAVNGIQTSYEIYIKNAEAGNSEQLLQSVKNISIFGVAISHLIPKMPDANDQIKQLAEYIGEVAQSLGLQAENDKRTYAPFTKLPSSPTFREREQPTENLKRIKQILLEQEKHDERIKNSLAETERRLVVMEEGLKGLDQQALETLSKIDGAYLEALDQIKTKKEEIDSILGHVSGRAIAGDFEKSADLEKTAADWLRFGSLFCMALIVGVLGYSFWETIKIDFQWQKSLFRVALAFLLSAPAAYLARESAKHRTQQYLHLQTALDLKAISPYLASLPQEVQHKIKGDVAAKLFGGRDFSQVGSDSYPINTQELLMELLKKIELPKIASK